MAKYRPEIDGLRALAVVPVILFHLGYKWISGGYYGVDVFFVISGFLITQILVDSIKTGNFSMLNFWLRRVRRLYPALLTVIIVMLCVSSICIFKPEVLDITRDAIPAILSYFNFHAKNNFGDYWGGRAESSFFLHTWSLSVEEQFYLLYPFFLFFSYRFFKNFKLPILFIGICSLLLFAVELYPHPTFTFYMLPARMWELSIGGLIGLSFDRAPEKTNKNIVTLLSILGIVLILIAYFFDKGSLSFWVLLPVAGTSLILRFCTQFDNGIGKILSNRPFVLIGKLSYSMYLWHWPLIVFFGKISYFLQDFTPDVINFIILILTVLLSFISYYLIENKTRKYKYTPIMVLGSVLFVMGFGFIYHKTDFINKTYPNVYSKVQFATPFYNVNPWQAPINSNEYIYYNVNYRDISEKNINSCMREGIITLMEHHPTPELVLLGDSHGGMWGSVLDEICDEHDISRSFFTFSGQCPFFNPENLDDQPSSSPLLNEEQYIEYAKNFMNKLEIWKPGLLLISVKLEDRTDLDLNNLYKMLKVFQSKNINVIIFTDPPKIGYYDALNTAQYLSYLGEVPVAGEKMIDIRGNDEINKKNDLLRSFAREFYNVTIFDVNREMTVNNKMVIANNRDCFYFDDDHLSGQGTHFYKKLLEKIILEKMTVR